MSDEEKEREKSEDDDDSDNNNDDADDNNDNDDDDDEKDEEKTNDVEEKPEEPCAPMSRVDSLTYFQVFCFSESFINFYFHTIQSVASYVNFLWLLLWLWLTYVNLITTIFFLNSLTLFMVLMYSFRPLLGCNRLSSYRHFNGLTFTPVGLLVPRNFCDNSDADVECNTILLVLMLML